MGLRQRQWAKKEKKRLIEVLGGKCFECGRRSDLTFDCIEPRGHDHHKGSTQQRVIFYRRQFFEGNLGLLCDDCNTRKGNGPPLPRMLRKIHRVRVLASIAFMNGAPKSIKLQLTPGAANPF